MSLVDDVRHDVYLTLDHGVFNKGTKRADKNVEIDMEIIDEKEQIITVRAGRLDVWYSTPSYIYIG